MSVIHEWSVRLASEVAPDEAELAPIMTDAFVSGGKDEKELFAKGKNVASAFGLADMVIIFPFVLAGVGTAAPQLIKAFGSPMVDDYLSCIKNILSFFDIRKTNETASERPKLPSDEPYALLRQISDVVYKELRKSKRLSDEDCAAISFRILRVLLEEPKGASAFVRAVAKER